MIYVSGFPFDGCWIGDLVMTSYRILSCLEVEIRTELKTMVVMIAAMFACLHGNFFSFMKEWGYV